MVLSFGLETVRSSIDFKGYSEMYSINKAFTIRWRDKTILTVLIPAKKGFGETKLPLAKNNKSGIYLEDGTKLNF